MNRALVDRIANAVLYEGYILYPYRPSVKNRQRWTFGGLYPEAYCQAQRSGDAPSSQTECLIRGSPATAVEAVVRFLHLTARQVRELIPTHVESAYEVGHLDPAPEPASARFSPGGSAVGSQGRQPLELFRPVESLRVGERLYQTWQEAEEREVVLGEIPLAGLLDRPRVQPFTFPGGRRSEPMRGPGGEVRGVLVREQQAVAGVVEVAAVEAADGLFRLTLRVLNRTPLADAGRRSRDDALLHSLVSAHALLGVRGGAFVSLLDPPDCWRAAAAACRNIGVWPALVGAEGQADTVLASPIILYDYPQVAPESPCDFFDGTEIDEMLTLRVLTLTDEEKRAMAAVDERAGELLARTEALARDQLRSLHGTVRGVRPVAEEGAHG